MTVRATVITADGRRVVLDGQCSRQTMETIIDAAYPGARRVSLIVAKGA
jgi:hypothetical protein